MAFDFQNCEFYKYKTFAQHQNALYLYVSIILVKDSPYLEMVILMIKIIYWQ